MGFKSVALLALASTTLLTPAFGSDMDQLMKEINALKATVAEQQKQLKSLSKTTKSNATTKSEKSTAPQAAPTFNYVKTCEAYGEGYYVIPGTSTCLRFSGYARGNITGYENSDPYSSYNNRTVRNADYGSRIRLNTDFRSSTDMGVLRGFNRVNLDLAPQTASGSSGLAGSPRMEYSYVTLGGFSAGIQDTAFSFFNAPGEVTLIVPDDNQKLLAASYTMPLASGLTATASIENPYPRQANPAYGSSPTTTTGVTDQPDVVGALQWLQGPTTVKVAGATHQSVGQTTGEKQGYAVQGGLKYVFSPETTVFLQGTYANAAMAYLGYGRGTNYGFSSAGILGVGITPDFEQNTSGALEDTSSGQSILLNVQQKLGEGIFWATATYGQISDRSGRSSSNAYTTYTSASPTANVDATVQQYEVSYIFKPYMGLNIQPAISYQKIDNSTTDTKVDDYSQYKGMLRIWREF
jgi:Porin subfamily